MQAILAAACARGIAVVPFGGGTSVVGGVTACRGRFNSVVTLDTSAMDRVIDIDVQAMTATFEAGITGPALEKALALKNLTLGHHPQSFEFSTLGAGSHAAPARVEPLRPRRRWAVGAKLAPRAAYCRPEVSLHHDRSPPERSRPGFRRCSEHAEATVRLGTQPAASEYYGYLFKDFASGIAAIRSATRDGIAVTMLRLSDPVETKFYRAFATLGRKRTYRDRFAQLYLDNRGFDEKACAMIAGFEGTSAAVVMHACDSTCWRRKTARSGWAKHKASVGKRAASTDLICATR